MAGYAHRLADWLNFTDMLLAVHSAGMMTAATSLTEETGCLVDDEMAISAASMAVRLRPGTSTTPDMEDVLKPSRSSSPTVQSPGWH
jgi:hypothetical protein